MSYLQDVELQGPDGPNDFVSVTYQIEGLCAYEINQEHAHGFEPSETWALHSEHAAQARQLYRKAMQAAEEEIRQIRLRAAAEAADAMRAAGLDEFADALKALDYSKIVF